MSKKNSSLTKEYLEDCNNQKTIENINNLYDYEDVYPHGTNDNSLVSCGQDNKYNELQYIYDEILLDFIESGDITEDDAIMALCKACKEIESPRKRAEFYDFLESELNIDIER